jgi:two-component SAPR family response regulator
MNGETNLNKLIANMKPHLNDGTYVFCTLKTMVIDLENVLCFFKETEGITIVCSQIYADAQGFAYHGTFAWMTLQVHSALEAVGLTAAFSDALAKNQISCNVIAGYYHDHLFVPIAQAQTALNTLMDLSKAVHRQNEDSIQPRLVQPINNLNDYHIDKLIYTQVAQNDEGAWKILCLGDLKVFRNNEQLIDWQTKGGATKKLKTLFAYLLFKGEKGASTEELADLLWADTLDMTLSINRLYHTIRYLRAVLEGNQTATLRQSSFILHQNNRYYLTLPPHSWTDEALVIYQKAEQLYQGDLLTDLPQKYLDNTEQDWCWSRRFWYRDMHHKLLHNLATIHRCMGNLSEALNYCEKAFALEPSSEPAHREKLLALKAANRMDAVHRQYRLYCESLKKFDLGTPSQEMITLYAKIIEKK